MPRLTNLMSAAALVSVSFARVNTNLLILPDFSATSWRMASSCCSSVPVPERRTCEAHKDGGYRSSGKTGENERVCKAC